MIHQKNIPTKKADLTSKQRLEAFNQQLNGKILEMQNIIQSAQRNIMDYQLQIAFNKGKIELLEEMKKEPGKIASP